VYLHWNLKFEVIRVEGVTLADINLDVDTSSVYIKELLIDDPEFYNYIEELDEEDRVDYIKRSLKVGAVVLSK